MPSSKSVETHLLVLLGVIALIAVLGVLAILPYRLYSRDIRHATVEAHRVASVLNVALADAIAHGEDASGLINRFQGIADLRISLRKLEGDESHPAAESRRGTSTLDGTELTYVGAPILDKDGSTWLAEMVFDLSPMKRESVRLIIDLVLAVSAGSLAFSVLVFWLVRQYLVVPLRRTTEVLKGYDGESGAVTMPEFGSSEMRDLARAVETACRTSHPARP
jgi:hypothetical protein